jgi:hypothetical protein
MITFEQLKQLVEGAQEDVQKFEAGNKAAGTRLRKKMQDIKQAAQAIRQAVLDARGDEGPDPQAQ